MLNGLIITSAILWIAGFFVNGFSLYNVLIIIPTIMFSLRKFGIHIQMGHMIAVEVLLLFFSTAWRLIFHKFYLAKFIIGVIIRLIFFAIVAYDDNVYIYVQEERKRE